MARKIRVSLAYIIIFVQAEAGRCVVAVLKRKGRKEMNVNEQIEDAIIDFSKRIVDLINEGILTHSMDLVDYTVDYLNELRERGEMK